MVLFLLAFLFVIFLPLATGGLLALLLREVHARHPLPLVELGYVNAWNRPGFQAANSQAINRADFAKELETLGMLEMTGLQETLGEPVADDAGKTRKMGMGMGMGMEEEGDAALIDAALLDGWVGEGTVDEENADEENTSFHSGVSVFDGSGIIPKDLPVSDALNLMTAEDSAVIPHALEHRIEESTRLKDGLPHEIHPIRDDSDFDDWESLPTALPKAKIDFTQEFETDSEESETMSPMAKELLGEDFDFDALEQQSHQTSAETMLDVQTDEARIVQVSSPFLLADSSQLADFTVPQMVLPTFSGDWIQESGSVIAPAEVDASNFCFTEESQPMFVRKKKAN